MILWCSGVNKTCNNTLIISMQTVNIKFLGMIFVKLMYTQYWSSVTVKDRKVQ
jgi:hypothetical protein